MDNKIVMSAPDMKAPIFEGPSSFIRVIISMNLSISTECYLSKDITFWVWESEGFVQKVLIIYYICYEYGLIIELFYDSIMKRPIIQ